MVTKNFARFLNGYTSFYDRRYNFNTILQNIKGEDQVINVQDMDDSYANTPQVYSSALFHRLGLASLEDKGTNYNGCKTGMFFGNGTTPATTNDYKLDSMLDYSVGALTLVSQTVTNVTDKDTPYIYTYTIRNNGAEDITISESALISRIFDNSKSSSAPDFIVYFLWARDTFEPVTLQPGETRAFTMTIGLE